MAPQKEREMILENVKRDVMEQRKKKGIDAQQRSQRSRRGPHGEAASVLKDEAVNDSDGGDQLINQYAATEHVLVNFHDGLADCMLDQCLLSRDRGTWFLRNRKRESYP
ncbi:hypothetical protein F5Y06DRAFT_297230 [Hypoxylon sp. FL0890]|nr:hypothetical protein F5Y06DRAFT_297230 [Hypoxylon sp. FL0890]